MTFDDLSFNYAYGVLGALAIFVLNLRITASRKLILRVAITKEHYKNSLIFAHNLLEQLSEHSEKKGLVKREMILARKLLDKNSTDINIEISELFLAAEQLNYCLKRLDSKFNTNLSNNAKGTLAVSLKIRKHLEKELGSYSQRNKQFNQPWFSNNVLTKQKETFS
jgi:hypothetical protein